jgi:hypothetical protein
MAPLSDNALGFASSMIELMHSGHQEWNMSFDTQRGMV